MLTASAVGIPSKTSWSTTAVRRTGEGEVYLAVGVSGSEEAPHVGRSFIRAVEEFPLDSAGTLYSALQDALKQLPQEVAVSLALVYQQEQQITVFTFGFGLIALVRPGQSRWLMDGSREQQVLEGVVQAGDRLFLATARVRELQLPLTEWADFAPDEIGAELIGRFQRADNSGELAALIVKEQDEAESSAEPSDLESSNRLDHSNHFDQTGQAEPAEETSDEFPFLSENTVQAAQHGAQHSAGFSHAETASRFELLPQYDASKHLIPPEKLQAGILATQEDQAERWKRSWSTDSVAQVLQTIRQLSWLKIVLVIGVIFALIGGLFAWRTWRIQQEYQAVIVPLEELVQQAEGYPEDQRLQQRDTVRSLVERLEATRVNNRTNRTKLQELTTQMKNLYSSISGEREVVNLPVFYDFRLVSSDFLATRADRFEDQAVFFDPNGQKLIALDLRSKSNRTVSHEILAGAEDLVAADGEAYVLKQDSVQRVPLGGTSPSELLSISEPEPAYLDRFSGNVYVFARGNQQLWRFAVGSDTTASPSAWIRSAPGINFGTITSLAIDGSVWMGSSTGEVFKLTRGERDSFSLQGLLEPFTSSLLVAAVENGERLAVAEPSSNRLVLFDKNGVYQQQISSPQLGGVTDLFWGETENEIYLVAGSVVYRVNPE